MISLLSKLHVYLPAWSWLTINSATERRIGKAAHASGIPREQRQPGKSNNIKKVVVCLYLRILSIDRFGLSGIRTLVIGETLDRIRTGEQRLSQSSLANLRFSAPKPRWFKRKSISNLITTSVTGTDKVRVSRGEVCTALPGSSLRNV